MALVYRLGPFCYRLLCSTYRVRVVGEEIGRTFYRGKPAIGATWHQRLFCVPFLLRRIPKLAFIVSRSKDGEMIRYVLEGLGYPTMQGSSTRGGGAAYLEMVRHLRAGGSIGITPDGPRGPAREVQPGTARLAVETGTDIVPVSVSAHRCWFAPSWDRFLFPRPFTRISLHWGTMITVRRGGGEEEVARVTAALKEKLDALTAEADRVWGRTNAPWKGGSRKRESRMRTAGAP
jgi:hypothetical protein